MAGPTKKEVSQAARDLANPNTPKTQKQEAAEVLNYRKETLAKVAAPKKRQIDQTAKEQPGLSDRETGP